MQPHGRQPTRLPRPWDSPGKNTGVGCHFLLQCKKVKSESEDAQSYLTLSDLMDCSLPGSSVHGIFQARVLAWVAIAFSDNIATECLILELCTWKVTLLFIFVVVQSLSCVWLFVIPRTVAHQASLSMGFSTQAYWSGYHTIFQTIFPTQGSKSGLLHCRQSLYHLRH